MDKPQEINGFQVFVVEDEHEGGKVAFELVQAAYAQGAQVFGLATGSTPETLYEELKASNLDFSDRVSVNLDEYVGLSGDHPQSYRYFMEEKLFNEKPFKQNFVPNGLADEEAEIQRYNQVLQDYPIDLQILGIGTNAHIAFNEPGTSFEAKTHKVKLTEATIEANKRFFDAEEDVPRYAYSMGIASILEADQIILLAYGPKKAQAIRDMIHADKTEQIPATALQDHANVTVVVDQAAAEKLAV